MTSPLPFRPKLVSEPKPKNEFAILSADVRKHAGEVQALAATINRALGGPFSTVESLSIAADKARELADAANALDRAIRRARR